MARRVTFGIGGRLFLAFGGVATMTVIAGMVAWLSFANLSDSLMRIVNDDLPAMTAAARLAEKGGQIIATAPTLVSALAEKDRAEAWGELDVILSDMSALIEAISPGRFDPKTKIILRSVISKIASNLTELDQNVRRRFWFATTNAEFLEQLRWAHADFLDEVEPLIEDARFNIETAIERAEYTRDTVVVEVHRNILREEIEKREALLKVNASGNLAVGLIARAASLSNAKSLGHTFQFLGEISSLLTDGLLVLDEMPSSVSLRQSTEDILAFAAGPKDLFELRREELETIGRGRELLAINRGLIENLKTVIADQVSSVNIATLETALHSRQNIGRGKAVLLAVAAVSLLVAVLVAWLYVGRNLVRRIRSLGDSMRVIAAGDLTAEVATGGVDEISEMAEALRIFRDTAAETQAELVQAAKLAALGQLSTGIAHELNQPLAAIRSYAHNTRILFDRNRGDEARANLGKISELIERMARISNHLKSFARRPAKTVGKADMKAVAQNALSLLDGQVKSENVLVRLDFPPGELFVRGEEIQLEQVLINLITNAIDAMKDSERRDLSVLAAKGNGTVTVRIEDTGKEVSDSDLVQIFDPFFTTKDIGEGLGLGLSISYKIVQDFGGSISAAKKGGGGMSFTMELPVA